MTAIGSHGSLGSSKTACAVFFGFLWQNIGYQVVSNIELDRYYFPNYINMNESDEYSLDYFYDCAVRGKAFPWPRVFFLGDEWQYYADSRMSMDASNIVSSYLFIQSRKRHMVIFITTKKKKYADVRDRESEDISIKCYKKHADGLKCFNHDCELPHYFEWIIIDVENGIGKAKAVNPINVYGLNLFKMYKSEELTAPVSGIKTDDLMDVIKHMDIGGSIG